MRTIQFTPNDLRFDIIYSALLQSPIPLRGSTERKAHVEVLGKLEAIGKLKRVRDQKTGEERDHRKDELALYETETGGAVTLSDSEYDLIKRHTTSVVEGEYFPKAWSRQGEAIMELFETLQPDAPAVAA